MPITIDEFLQFMWTHEFRLEKSSHKGNVLIQVKNEKGKAVDLLDLDWEKAIEIGEGLIKYANESLE